MPYKISRLHSIYTIFSSSQFYHFFYGIHFADGFKWIQYVGYVFNDVNCPFKRNRKYVIMGFCQPLSTIHSFRTVVKSLCFLIIYAILLTATTVQASSADEYIKGTVSKPKLRLFADFADPMTAHDTVLKTRYHLFELSNTTQAYSLTPPIFSQNGRSIDNFSWLFNRFNSKSKGLIILPILKSGVHISYKLDF